jgi:anti-sigma-K factor RskA
MKPCSKNRKLIAWLALDALEARKAAALRAHISSCEGCRRYWEEMANVTARLASAEPDSDLAASDCFHRRVTEKLRAVESSSLVERLAERVRGAMPNWRVALPATALLALALLVMTASRHDTAPFTPPAPVAQGQPASGSDSDPAPTLGNYQMIANQSLDKLSDLLTRQGNRSLPPAPVYTASSIQPANGSF